MKQFYENEYASGVHRLDGRTSNEQIKNVRFFGFKRSVKVHAQEILSSKNKEKPL